MNCVFLQIYVILKDVEIRITANMEINGIPFSIFKEARWPLMMIWERINHAYTSDSPPENFGIQRDNCGFQNWTFTSHNEKYVVVWDTDRSYWKVNTPFVTCHYFIGPLFIDKSGNGLKVPPFTVIESDSVLLVPALPSRVKEKMSKIPQLLLNHISELY